MATVFNTLCVKSVLATVILWMLGRNILYTVIAFLIAPAGLTASIDMVLMTFRLAALAAIWARPDGRPSTAACFAV